MTDILIGTLILLILGAAVFYIHREKKNGAKCIGCPHSGSCGKAGGCNCGCGK